LRHQFKTEIDMAKADTKSKKAAPKKRSSKKADATAASNVAKAKATSKKRSSKSAEAKSTTKAAGDKAEASASSASSKAATAAADSTAQAGTSAGALDPALLPALSGKVGVFGGPKDRGIKPEDKLALPTGRHFTFERVRSLNPKSFYCAMRWDYHVLGKSIGEGQRWWANKKLLVTNPANGSAVVVRAVDFGPPESTGLAIAVSPGAADALGVNVGDDVEIAFADPRMPTGAVQ
jgi:hypothetical protein